MCYIYLPRRNPSLCHPRQEWFGVELLKLYQPWSIKEGVGSWKQGSAVAWVWLAAQPVIRPSRFAPRVRLRSSCMNVSPAGPPAGWRGGSTLNGVSQGRIGPSLRAAFAKTHCLFGRRRDP